MNTSQFVHTPELSSFETPQHIRERLENEYDHLQRFVRRYKIGFSSVDLDLNRSLRHDILETAREQGFDFLNDSTVGVLYYEPLTTRRAHVDPRGKMLIVTTSGNGTYRQYPNTDEFKDRACLEQPIKEDEAEHVKGVQPGSALLTNQTIPHSFHTASFSRTAFYIAA